MYQIMHLHTQLKVSMITWNKIISGGGREAAGIGHGGGSILEEGWRARGAGASRMARVAEVLGAGRIGYPAQRRTRGGAVSARIEPGSGSYGAPRRGALSAAVACLGRALRLLWRAWDSISKSGGNYLTII